MVLLCDQNAEHNAMNATNTLWFDCDQNAYHTAMNATNTLWFYYGYQIHCGSIMVIKMQQPHCGSKYNKYTVVRLWLSKC